MLSSRKDVVKFWLWQSGIVISRHAIGNHSRIDIIIISSPILILGYCLQLLQTGRGSLCFSLESSVQFLNPLSSEVSVKYFLNSYFVKGLHEDREKSAHGMKENICNTYIWQKIDVRPDKEHLQINMEKK